jgi:acetyl esterase/lipase
MLYFHGGGYISGNLDAEDPRCRIFAAKSQCVVVSVTYPLSPPALLDDIIDVGVKSVTWVRLILLGKRSGP